MEKDVKFRACKLSDGCIRLVAPVIAIALAASTTACGSTSRNRQTMLITQAAAARQPGNPAGDPTSTGRRTGPGIDDSTYRLAPGDLIDVKFPYHPEENERVPVRPDGRIGLQSAGDVAAAGMTVRELEAAIVEKTSRTLRNPVVSVVIVQLAEHKVYVGGDVSKPGYVVYRDGLTPLEAIIERGGFLDTAKTSQVIYITRNGKEVRAEKIDLEKVVEGEAAEQVVMSPDDILFVPKTWIGEANVVVDQWIRGLLPTVPRPGFDLTAF